jgi:hypothetical protein
MRRLCDCKIAAAAVRTPANLVVTARPSAARGARLWRCWHIWRDGRPPLPQQPRRPALAGQRAGARLPAPRPLHRQPFLRPGMAGRQPGKRRDPAKPRSCGSICGSSTSCAAILKMPPPSPQRWNWRKRRLWTAFPCPTARNSTPGSALKRKRGGGKSPTAANGARADRRSRPGARLRAPLDCPRSVRRGGAPPPAAPVSRRRRAERRLATSRHAHPAACR